MKKWIGILCLSLLVGCPAQENTEQNTRQNNQTKTQTTSKHEEAHDHASETKKEMGTKSESHSHDGGEEHSHASEDKHSHDGGEEHSHGDEDMHSHDGAEEHSHEAGGHDHNKSPHGGILMDKDGEHWELVPHTDHIDFFLLDGNLKTISLQGASAELLIQGEKETRTVKLMPEEENLMGKGVFDPAKETAVLTLKRGDKTQMLRFGK